MFAEAYLNEAVEVVAKLDRSAIERMAAALAAVRGRGGRLFILGVGGSAASASHAVNDFRKLAGFEAYAPTDNVSELTARANDEGWAGIFTAWLEGSRLNEKDALLILSVGGGDREKNISVNLAEAVDLAVAKGAAVLGLLGRDGGYTARKAEVAVIVPTVNPSHVTPHTEAFHCLLWHLLVTHPSLKAAPAKWESAAS